MTVTPDATAASPACNAASPAPSLRSGSLGTTDIAFFVVSAAAPLTVMAGVAPLAILMGGIGAPIGYLVAGLTLAVFAVGFTTMSRHVRSAGAFYAYITRGLGRRAGIGAALLALIGYNGMEIGVYGLLGTATRDTARALLGADIPWVPVSLVGLLLIGYAGFRSIDFGAKLLGVLLVAETGILVLLAGGVLIKGGADGLSFASFAPDNVMVSGMVAVLAFAFAAAGADPYMQLLPWVNTSGMLALMLLQVLAALAVPFCFRRVTHTEGVLRTVLAPVVAAVLLTGAIALVVSHLDQFTGASTAVNTFLAALVIGLVLALWLRRARPEVYANFAAEPPAASGD